jgi:glutathione S-transferase
LVHEGRVHIESNDIILHLESAFPGPALVPGGRNRDIEALLKHENDLHLDLRTVTFRFVFPRPSRPRMSAEVLALYATAGSGTVRGAKDAQIAHEISYWEEFEAHGISDDAVRISVGRLRDAFSDLNDTLNGSTYVSGKALSVADIAWFVYVHRVQLSGYPLARMHESLYEWYTRLARVPEIARELVLPQGFEKMIRERQVALRSSSQSLEEICQL